MEYRVGGNEVLVTLERSYVAEDDAALLQQVTRFKPFVDYLTTFKPQDFVVSVFTISNISLIAGRVSAVAGTLTLKHKLTKELRVEPITLTDAATVVVLPVITVGTTHYAVLVKRPRIAVGGASIAEAFTGHFGKDGNLVADGGDLLKALGLHVSEKTCSALSNEDIVLGHEGQAPVKIVRATKIFTEQSFDDAMATPITSEDGTSLEVIELDQVMYSTSDLKAIVAASLLQRTASATSK